MNPEQIPSIQTGPESGPPDNETGENLPGQERVGEQTHEREQNLKQVDRNISPAPPPAAIPLPPQPVPLPVKPIQDDSDDTSSPTLAADDDLIEKEWVDKAKKIISETQNDPYKREKAIGKLQADYLRKRYGKELGVSN